MFTLIGLIFTLFASTKRPKFKPDVEFDDLAAGLNIDLGYYLNESDNSRLGFKKKKSKDEELSSLLNR